MTSVYPINAIGMRRSLCQRCTVAKGSAAGTWRFRSSRRHFTVGEVGGAGPRLHSQWSLLSRRLRYVTALRLQRRPQRRQRLGGERRGLWGHGGRNGLAEDVERGTIRGAAGGISPGAGARSLARASAGVASKAGRAGPTSGDPDCARWRRRPDVRAKHVGGENCRGRAPAPGRGSCGWVASDAVICRVLCRNCALLPPLDDPVVRNPCACIGRGLPSAGDAQACLRDLDDKRWTGRM